MKRNISFLMWFAVIVLVFSACHEKKASEQTTTEDIQSEIQITQELKKEIIRIFEEYQQHESSYFKTMEEGRNIEMKLKDKITVPLNYAEKAQTLDQKYFLIGMYLECVLGERYFLGIIDQEQAKVIKKLAVKTNLPALASINWEEEVQKTWDELQSKKAKHLLTDFKSALNNDNADKFIQIALGAYIQGKYSQSIVREAMGERAKSEPPAWEVYANLEKYIVELVDKLLPFYPSLETTLPLINDMRALHKDMTDEEMEIAYSKYIEKLKEHRAAFLSELQ